MNTKPKAVIISTVVAVLAIVAAFAIYPALVTSASSSNAPNSSAPPFAASGTTPSTIYPLTNGSWPQGGQRGGPGNGGFHGQGPPGPLGGPSFRQSAVNFTVGQTFSIASTHGQYSLATNRSETGTASGSLTFTVIGKFAGGYTLSLKSGSITINGNTYTVSSGSAQMGQFGNALSGQGTTSPSGNFLIQAQARGSFAGSTASVFLDFENGTSEYAVALTGNVTN